MLTAITSLHATCHASHRGRGPCAGAMGSPGFVAPEIIMHEPHTPAMDIFSLGIVLFIMLVGRKPFNIKDIEHLAYCNMDIHEGPGLQDSR